MDERREQVLVICGSTATGKTDLAITLARHVSGEIVNADSRQVYRSMDIGTAKPTPAQRAAAPHHLLDVVDPDEPFTLADYLEQAHNAIAGILTRGGLPIVVGGTGLYVRALAQGFAVPRVPPDPRLRAELEALAEAEGTPALLARLRGSDAHTAATIDVSNPRRLIRAIEVDDAVQATKLATHGFIRRQLTWFRCEPGIHWLDIAHGDVVTQAIVQAEQWLAVPMAAMAA